MVDLRIDATQPGIRGKYDAVEVVVGDLDELRALTVTPGVRARTVEVRGLDGELLGVRVDEARVAVHDVVAELGRGAVWPARIPDAGLGTDGIDIRVHNPVGLVLDGSEVPDLADLDAGQKARLAMQGVPLGYEEAGYDPTTGLSLEEHSIVVRRQALDAFGAVPQPPVSIVMATRRPEMLTHALSQVARQRRVGNLELVLVTHGFEADDAHVRGLLGGADVLLTTLARPSEVVFGDVLNVGAQAAQGEVVLKMDDDDWYSPDFVADLLRARAYSGADLVGTPDELYYLEDRNVTLRLGHASEVYRGFVAGGTMLIGREVLDDLGGFAAVPRHVDRALIAAVRESGGTVYRTHGLGYLLRRTSAGHTWQADHRDLMRRAVQTWRGFRPGHLMEL
jgi:hypothetical protein